jgi:mono/diheme cytochrome c family protein
MRTSLLQGWIPVGVTVALVAAVVAVALYLDRGAPDLRDDRRIAAGKAIYDGHCASCHGVNLEGQPNWTTRLPTGRMPAPPHDDSGHTWHHSNDVLFAITKFGFKAPYAPVGYPTDMQAFAGTLSDDDIWNVLAFIQSRWSDQVRARHDQLQRQIASGHPQSHP